MPDATLDPMKSTAREISILQLDFDMASAYVPKIGTLQKMGFVRLVSLRKPASPIFKALRNIPTSPKTKVSTTGLENVWCTYARLR